MSSEREYRGRGRDNNQQLHCYINDLIDEGLYLRLAGSRNVVEVSTIALHVRDCVKERVEDHRARSTTTSPAPVRVLVLLRLVERVPPSMLRRARHHHRGVSSTGCRCLRVPRTDDMRQRGLLRYVHARCTSSRSTRFRSIRTGSLQQSDSYNTNPPPPPAIPFRIPQPESWQRDAIE